MESEKKDWREQGQEKYLFGLCFRWQEYRIFRDGWDHDHCEFCSSKFSLDPLDLNEGYSTADNYRWICKTCFHDFKEKYHLKKI